VTKSWTCKAKPQASQESIEKQNAQKQRSHKGKVDDVNVVLDKGNENIRRRTLQIIITHKNEPMQKKWPNKWITVVIIIIIIINLISFTIHSSPNCNAFVTNLSNKSTHWMDLFQISHVHENEADQISHVWRSRALEDFQNVLVWPVPLAQVLPCPQLIFPFKTWFFGIYLNFQRQEIT
jgi:hypothetical protein